MQNLALCSNDYRRLQLDSAKQNTIGNSKRIHSLKNLTGRYLYGKLIWKILPSFIYTFPMESLEEVYGCQFEFLLNSGLGIKTRPRIYSVILTNNTSHIHQKPPKQNSWVFLPSR
jgi:hypothetical protein